MSFRKISPKIDVDLIKEEIGLSRETSEYKKNRDIELEKIIRGEDNRLLLIIGPCSSDNQEAVLEYARRLAILQNQVADKVFIVMRVYTAKPRTNGSGYKGLVHQPDSSRSADLFAGIKASRSMHKQVIEETGLTTADELLYPSSLEFMDDLVSYIAVGARSVENQEHRFLASGINQPVGMKNPTGGNLNIMFNALYASQQSQNFIFADYAVESSGNPLSHAVMRGATNKFGKNIPNYYYENILDAIELYEQTSLENPLIIIDTNHDNSGKNYQEQIRIVRDVLMSRNWNDKIKKYVRGFMIESYLEDGRQEQAEIFGKSLTDPCLGWNKAEELIQEIYKSI